MTNPFLPLVPLDVLAHLVAQHELWLSSREAEGRPLALRDAAIRGASLTGRRLQRCSLTGVTIEDSDLSRCQLGGSALIDVHVMNCKLIEARLSDSTLARGSIVHSACDGASMGGLMAEDLELRESSFRRSNWAKCSIRRSVLSSISFEGGHLLKMYVQESDLSDCDFTGANMMKVHFVDTALRGCSFHEALVDKMLLVGVRMMRCKGVPREYVNMSIDRVDLSEMGDGSRMLGRDMVETLVAELRGAE